jgi:predicted transcriptional regulator
MPAEQPTSIRLPARLKKRLQAAADAEHRRLSVQIVHILHQWLEWFERPKK